MDKVLPGLLSGVVVAAVTALFYWWEYHAVARTGSGYLSLCLLSGAALVLTILDTSSPTYRNLACNTRPKSAKFLVLYTRDGSQNEMRVDIDLFLAARNSIREAALKQGVDVRFPNTLVSPPP